MKRDTFSGAGMSDEVEELLTGYVLNQLSAQERASVETLIQQLPQLQGEVAQLEAIIGLMAHDVVVQAPATLRSRILAAARPTAAPVARKRLWRKGAIAAILAVGLGIALGLDNYRLRTQVAQLESDLNILTELEHQTFALQGTAASPQAAGNILLDLHNARAVIAFQNVPVLPKGSIYQLWALTSGKAIPCGTFQSNPSGQVLVNIAIPIEEYAGKVTRMFVTQESSMQAQHPSTQVVMDSVS